MSGVLFNKSQTTLIEYPGGVAGSYTIPNSVTNIGNYAFVGCSSLTGVTIPGSVTGIGGEAFYSCTSLASVSIPGSVIGFGEGAFQQCTSLTNVTILNGVTNIGDSAFYYCTSLASVTIPGSVSTIAGAAFQQCASLTNVTIPASVTGIGEAGFQNCIRLAIVCFEGNAPTDGGEIFSGDSGLSAVYHINGTTGWGPTFSGFPTASCAQCGGTNFTAQYYMTMDSGSNGSVSPSSGWQNSGASVPISATPNGGFVFSGWTGTGSGSYSGPNNPAMVVMTGAIVETASFIAGRFIPGNGTYSGLFYDETNGVKQESSGSFTITTTAKRKFSGSLQIGGSRYSLRGVFGTNGYVVTTAKSAGSSLSVVLQMDLVPDADRITGAVSSAAGWTAELAGDLAVIPPQAGQKYTMIMPGEVASNTVPGGDSYGTISVSKSGIITLSGALADGTKISQKATVSQYGQWPFYVPLYSGQGCILGWITFTNAPLEDLTGELTWIKLGGKGSYYANNFTLATTASGSRYQPGTPVLDFTSPVLLVLNGGNLAESITNEISLGANNKVTVANDTKLRLTFTLPTGLFSGKMANGNNLIPFNGVVLQKANMCAGFFLGTDQSGPVLIEPASPGP
jgi:hypothetical protein